jgi:hypothetical protein
MAPRFLSLDEHPTLRAAREAQCSEAYTAACAALGMGHIQQAEPLALRRLARYVAGRAPKTVTIHEPYGTSYEIEVEPPKE